jgi:hypothetical protein
MASDMMAVFSVLPGGAKPSRNRAIVSSDSPRR